MYAVIKTGGKQYRVEEGQQLDVERLTPGSETLEFTPILLVDGDAVLSNPSALSGATVSARVLGDAAGPKIIGFKYKNKTNQRKRWGHRQHYNTIEITGIRKG